MKLSEKIYAFSELVGDAFHGAPGLVADIVTLFMLPGMAAGIVSFFFVGIGGVFKFVWNIAKWGFVAVPFPICLLAVPVTFFIGLYVLLFVPILPVFSVHRKKMAGLA